MRATLTLCVALAAAATPSFGQDVSAADFAAWAARNDYEPSRDFRSYLDISPGNMGPNALPVFGTVRGQVDTAASFGVSLHTHWAPGDRATDIGLAAKHPFGRRASLRVSYLLREWYRYDESVALSRNTVRGAGRGSAAGDVYVDALFQVLAERRKQPGVVLSARIKTASGGDVEAMRFTDTPGYAFDVSAGRSFRTDRLSWRPYAALGFYVWQRFGQDNPQNDAFTYAGGVQLTGLRSDGKGASFVASAEVAGYIGYTEQADAPAVLRAEGSYSLGANAQLRLGLRVERGLHDWDYTSAGLRLGYTLPGRVR